MSVEVRVSPPNEKIFPKKMGPPLSPEMAVSKPYTDRQLSRLVRKGGVVMKINEAQGTVAAHRAVAPPSGGDVAADADLPPPTAPAVRVTTDDAISFKASVANGMTMAAGERSLRIQTLTQAVRSGGYRPSVSQLADQILAQAELDARLAAALA